MVERVQGMCVKMNLILPLGSVTFEILKSLDSNFTNKIKVSDMPKLPKKKKKKSIGLRGYAAPLWPPLVTTTVKPGLMDI